jgi:hypothetical protein
MKIRYFICLFGVWLNMGWADFSLSQISLHPPAPQDGPFIIEIEGNWPTDCHPGEQKPVISAYDGASALIEFETIVVHITCNIIETPYRVLIDMSDVIGSIEGTFSDLDLTVRFGDEELNANLFLYCNLLSPPCPSSIYSPKRPGTGSYVNSGLDSQGLFITRQNNVMAVFPLVFDELGSSEWYVAGGSLVANAFFANLYELTGGQCLGCLPPAEPAQENLVGKLTLLTDGPGAIQVRVNDGLFTTYNPYVFGYKEINLGGSPRVSIPDLSGRWAFAGGDVGPSPSGGHSPFLGLPLVFDISLKQLNVPDLVVTVFPPGSAVFSILDVMGEEIAEILCDMQLNGEIGCTDDLPGEYSFELISPDRMVIAFIGPIIPEFPPGKAFVAARID